MFPLTDSIEHSRLPVVTWLLVTLNVLCFLFTCLLAQPQAEAFVKSFALVPDNFVQHFDAAELAKIFSSMFLHAGFAHLIGNVWFLWIFGDGVEDRLGRLSYLGLYFVCGVLAALCEVLFCPHLKLPMIGASGAISGVLGAYLIFFPRATVSTFIAAGLLSRIVEIPAPFYLGLWLLIQLISGFSSLFIPAAQTGSQTAFWAHIGGFMAGMLLARLVVALEQSQD